jgi:hypothetical protein
VKKKIIITWKIDEDVFDDIDGYNLKSYPDGDFRFIDFTCEKDEEKKLMIIRLSLKMTENKMKNIEEVGLFLVKESKDSSSETLFLIHYDPKELREYLDAPHTEFIDYKPPFGGGNGILYVKNNPNNGLIFEGGSLNENAFVNTDSHENIRLKDAVFDEIWDEYAVKKKIEKIILDIHKRFLPVTFDVSGLKQTAKDKRIEYLALIYKSYKTYHSQDIQYFRALLLDLLKLIVGIKFGQNLEPISKPGEEKISLLSIAKNHSDDLEDMLKQLFKEGDLGLKADYTQIDPDSKISVFFLGMDSFLKQVFTGDIIAPEQSAFWKSHLDPEAEKTEYYFPVWYCRLMEKLEIFYNYFKR